MASKRVCSIASIAVVALLWLGEVGWDPVYGARPLKRAIQQHIENPLAQKLLKGDFAPGETIKITRVGGELRFARELAN